MGVRVQCLIQAEDASCGLFSTRCVDPSSNLLMVIVHWCKSVYVFTYAVMLEGHSC